MKKQKIRIDIDIYKENGDISGIFEHIIKIIEGEEIIAGRLDDGYSSIAWLKLPDE